MEESLVSRQPQRTSPNSFGKENLRKTKLAVRVRQKQFLITPREAVA
jgi:hypothetical protein